MINLSIWERNTLEQFDLVVIGGGIVGLSTAYHFAKTNPKASVVIIERGATPNGASTKNAGFVCFGSVSELVDTEEEMGSQALANLVEKRYKGGLQLRKLLGDDKISYAPVGGYELLFNSKDHNERHRMNELLQPVFNGPVFSNSSDKIGQYGFSNKVKGLIKNSFEGTIDTGKMIRAFGKKNSERGVYFMNKTEVLDIQAGPKPEVQIMLQGESWTIKAGKVALCTNAFSSKFLPSADVVPGRGLVLVSKSVPGWTLDGSFHYHNGYNYFRSVGNRLLLGGGRHLDLSGEETTEFGINELILNQLKEDMNDFIAPQLELEVDYQWSGIMAFGNTKAPEISMVDEGIYAAYRLGGMGVALGTGVGQSLAQLLDGEPIG